VTAPAYPQLRLVRSDEPATILVVEDDEPIRLALREVLEVEGYQVVVACAGVVALHEMERGLPSLIITDLQMPNMDGGQLCDRVRSRVQTAEIPIVVLTAAHRLDAVEGRVDAIIRKPFDIDVLLSTVAQFIRPTLPPRAPAAPPSVRLSLRPKRPSFVLYVSPGSSASERAERTVRRVLTSQNHPFEVVDVSREESRARIDGVAMTPTLIRSCNGEREVFLGDLSEAMLVEEFASGA
jgi:two-component system phosphate regulon response regulator PhoB